ncbi:CoA-binding protein [Niveibacterium sp. 24ML]|uniref:CoA-binding protein n=1 Tax=Niveibacterium sp. 24ML TaxID=2985512 RepID=UPI00226E32DB|nr:CoA-binding protein [Niveibacterium sp. 24ML]MCX9155390.1 CoA-binding protein [Niveibacterium sp. 24ML]
MFKNPDLDTLRAAIAKVKTVAIVGASPKAERPSHYIGQFLKQQGLRVIPIHPAASELFGEKAYPSLSAVPEKIDLADFYINAERVGPLVDEAVALGIPFIWMQDHVVDEAAAQRAREAGATVVMDDCIYRRWRQLTE